MKIMRLKSVLRKEYVVPLVYQNKKHQKCVVYLKRSILNKVASKHKEELAADLKEVFDMDDHQDNIIDAFKRLTSFSNKWKKSINTLETC